MKNDLSVRAALPKLLEAALDERPIARLQAVVRTTPWLATGSVMRAWREHWTDAAQNLSLAELAALIRLLTLAETAIPGWSAGSVSPVIWLFHVYARSEGAATDTLADWVLAHALNDYLPYGTSNHGAMSLAELRTLQAVATESKTARRSGRAAWPERYANHSASFDHLRVSTFPLTAIPIACFWPTTTTSFLPLVMPV